MLDEDGFWTRRGRPCPRRHEGEERHGQGARLARRTDGDAWIPTGKPLDRRHGRPLLLLQVRVADGASRVVDYSDLGPTNPMHTRPPKQHVELVEQKSVKKITMADVRKMSAEQYDAALKDTDLAPQIEALVANQ